MIGETTQNSLNGTQHFDFHVHDQPQVMLNDPSLTYDAGEKVLPERVVDIPAPPIPVPEPSSSLALKIEDNSKTPVQILNELDATASFELIKEDCALLSHR